MCIRDSLKLELEIPEQISDLSPDIEQGFYRIAQEALLNIQKHAQATCFSVSLKQENGYLLMAVKDDGKGFEMKDINDEESFGIIGMQERAGILGAEIEILSEISGGTEIIVKLEHK
jgi:signal transduction histidine kinase